MLLGQYTRRGHFGEEQGGNEMLPPDHVLPLPVCEVMRLCLSPRLVLFWSHQLEQFALT